MLTSEEQESGSVARAAPQNIRFTSHFSVDGHPILLILSYHPILLSYLSPMYWVTCASLQRAFRLGYAPIVCFPGLPFGSIATRLLTEGPHVPEMVI